MIFLRNIRKIFFVIGIFMMFASGYAKAEDAKIEVSAQYDTAVRELKISGRYIKGAGRIVNIFIIPASESIESFRYDSIDTEKNAVLSAAAGEDGSFEINVSLPDKFETNEYSVYAVSSDISAESEFLYLNADIADEILKSAAGKGYVEFSQIIGANAKKLGIDNSGYYDNIDYINTSLYNFMPTVGYKSDEFIERYYKALAAARYVKGELSLDAFAEQLGMDTEELKSLTDNEKNILDKLVKETDLTKNEAAQVINENILTACLTGASEYEKLKTVMLKNREKLNLDMSDYNNLNSYYQNNVFKNVYEKGCKTELQFKNAFEQEAKTQLAAQNRQNSKNNSGGSGGGSSRGGSVNASFAPAAVQPQESEPEPKFSDTANHWAQKEISYLAQKGIVSGDGEKFRPDDTVTRAEFVKIAAMIFNTVQNTSEVFEDVSENDWFAGYVGGAVQAGLVNGIGTKFMPNEKITREDLCVIIARGLKNMNISLTGEYTFGDSGEISDYAAAAVSAMAGSGIVNGDNGNFRPKDYASRAEAVRIVYNVLQIMK